ncbi:hypothetical protein EZ449_07935 [Pedobacter frigidisoli]|uniref:Uncharacterized protein n=1 Tax=Pedobacter frigidisoli TaxID=2530455 RepID=A0A4R0P2M7_9SPHI|nr:hypothetical protein [Pedobacter frigidisoli]TCD10807.1 hypothetical protein EZ449_07935 [Pedobacter frigidisoli]
MKKTALIIILSLSLNYLHAQITSISMSVDDLKDAPFKFKGTRAMMVDRIDDASSKNIFVFSKVKSGSNPDTLYAEKFTKINEVWKLVQQNAITYKGIISIWGARKAFGDADKDKQVDALFIYSFHDTDMKNQLSVSLLLMHKGESYTITETPDKKNTFSANYVSLPESLKTYVKEYWDKLDKWK